MRWKPPGRIYITCHRCAFRSARGGVIPEADCGGTFGYCKNRTACAKRSAARYRKLSQQPEDPVLVAAAEFLRRLQS